MSKKFLKGILFIVIVFSIIYFLIKYEEPQKKYAHDKIKEGYKGCIVKKYRNRLYFLDIKIKDRIISNEFSPTNLWNFVEIGDSIYKIPNENKCIIYRDSIKSFFIYMSHKYAPLPEDCDSCPPN